MSEQIESLRYDENGYKTLVSSSGWRVAFMNSVSPKPTQKIAHLRSQSFVSNIIFCCARQNRSKSFWICEDLNKAQRKICLPKPGSSLDVLANLTDEQKKIIAELCK